MIHGFTVGPFCTTGRAALKKDCQFFKGQPGADGTDPSTGHTDGVSLFKRVCSGNSAFQTLLGQLQPGYRSIESPHSPNGHPG